MADDKVTAVQIPVEEENTIDESPISPSSPNAQRKNSLVQHLMNRPDKAELIQSMGARSLLPSPHRHNAAPTLLCSSPASVNPDGELGRNHSTH